MNPGTAQAPIASPSSANPTQKYILVPETDGRTGKSAR